MNSQLDTWQESRTQTALIRVLMVDDTPSMLALYEHMLRAEGFVVGTATDGLKALAMLGLALPDIIVLDLDMPIMGGLEVLQRVRANPLLSHIPVVFLTASGDDDGQITRAFELGADDYLTKPIKRRLLVERVRGIVEARRVRALAQVAEGRVREHDRIMEDVLRAESVQQGQLPPMPVEWNGWRATGALRPCDRVSGDLFDVVDGPPGEKTLAIIDVSGHGLGAAMVASSVRSLLRLLLSVRPFAEVLPELNRQLCVGNDGYFACVALIHVAADSIAIVNAGLPPVAVMHGARMVAEVSGSGLPPGIRPEAAYECAVFPIEAGMRIVAATDGLTEPFGLADAVDALLGRLDLRSRGSDLSQPALLARLAGLFASHELIQHDDATLLVLDRA